MAKFGINDILNAKTKAAGQQAQTEGYKEIYLSPYEVKAAQENTHQKLENIEELADSFLHVGQEQPTVLARVNGEHRIIDGHRRNAANILNLERGHKEYEKVLYRFMDMSEAMYIYEYHAKITSGEIIAGKWIKKIYEIIINGLQKQEYFFNAKAANKAIRFIENFCHHSKGRNDLIKLELWQKAIVSVIFGIQDAEKIRIFREIFIVIGRKNGKSLFASAIIAYMAYLEPEYGQEIYCLAPKLDQAALVYDGFYQMVQAEDELAELAKKRRSDIYIAESNTVIKPIAFNAKKSDGFNPQLVVCDEMAAWSGDAGLKQYEVMKSALGARTQPMILSISTAGYINDSIYDELMKRSTSFLKGNSKERRLLPFLYMIDDVEKWNDIDELKKANPNMGVSVKESFFMDEIAVAEGSLSKKAEFLTKYCNIKQNSSIAWLEYQTVENAGVEKTLEDFRDCYAVGGIDLSQTTDLTAASVVIQKDGTLYAFTQFFMPRGRLEYLQATDGVPYDIFVKKGLITLSGENYVDYHDVYGWFTMLLEDYGIRPLKIGYDRYSAQYLITDMANYGFHMLLAALPDWITQIQTHGAPPATQVGA